jgi:hypothetical protein
MRFRVFTWRFPVQNSQVVLRWPRLDILAGVISTVRSHTNQVRRARRIVTNHAFRRHRAYEIWWCKVSFHVFVQFLGIYSVTNPIQIHRWGKWLWDRGCVGYLCELKSGISQWLKQCVGSWEHKVVKCRVLLHSREFEQFLGTYFFTNTHGMVVVVRHDMCGVPVWTWVRHNSIIETLWRELRSQYVWGTCVDLIPAYVYHWSTVVEVERINTVKFRERVCDGILTDFRVPVSSPIHIGW